mmetsp:Transcript_24470/g.78125  ORF Transcript_24470/g.78125 Transcript_24470/m.78125 type:complete len:499 (+) Transcript_24470:572-2068(+)
MAGCHVLMRIATTVGKAPCAEIALGPTLRAGERKAASKVYEGMATRALGGEDVLRDVLYVLVDARLHVVVVQIRLPALLHLLLPELVGLLQRLGLGGADECFGIVSEHVPVHVQGQRFGVVEGAFAGRLVAGQLAVGAEHVVVAGLAHCSQVACEAGVAHEVALLAGDSQGHVHLVHAHRARGLFLLLHVGEELCCVRSGAELELKEPRADQPPGNDVPLWIADKLGEVLELRKKPSPLRFELADELWKLFVSLCSGRHQRRGELSGLAASLCEAFLVAAGARLALRNDRLVRLGLEFHELVIERPEPVLEGEDLIQRGRFPARCCRGLGTDRFDAAQAAIDVLAGRGDDRFQLGNTIEGFGGFQDRAAGLGQIARLQESGSRKFRGESVEEAVDEREVGRHPVCRRKQEAFRSVDLAKGVDGPVRTGRELGVVAAVRPAAEVDEGSRGRTLEVREALRVQGVCLAVARVRRRAATEELLLGQAQRGSGVVGLHFDRG